MERLELVKKVAASLRLAKHVKARIGRRPIRVDTLLKKGSAPGQDLRLPVMGGTKFPTGDSIEYAKSLLDQSQRSAEVGSAPSINRLKPPGPKIKDIVPGVKGTKNLMPKLGEAMDPLVQYLAKQAQPVADNEDSVPKGKEVAPVAAEDPTADSKDVSRAKSDQSDALSEYFDAKKGVRKKYEDKDHPVGTGVVDRILKSR